MRVPMSAYVTNGGSDGIMSTAGLRLPYPRVSRAKFRDETSRRGKYCYRLWSVGTRISLPVHCVWRTW